MLFGSDFPYAPTQIVNGQTTVLARWLDEHPQLASAVSRGTGEQLFRRLAS